MSLDFDSRYPRFHIGVHDWVTIDNVPFRLLQQTSDAFVLAPVAGEGMVQTFPFQHLNALNSAGRIKHEVSYFNPAEAVRRAAGPPDQWLALLTPEQKERIDWHFALVQAFNDLHRAGKVKKTEASIRAASADIVKAAAPYLQQTVCTKEIERFEEERKEDKGRAKKMAVAAHGGKAVLAVSPVHPRTLLKYVRACEQFGKVGLADRHRDRGRRGNTYGAEENALLAKTVERVYLNLNRATKKQTEDAVRDAFHDENCRRPADAQLNTPGRYAVRRYIASLDAFAVTLAREGVEAATAKHRPVTTGLEVKRPLERVEMDEWRIDLITLMSQAGLLKLFSREELEVLGLNDKKARWWIVAAIDCRTRILLGMMLTKDPKESSSMSCLRMVVSDKGSISDAVGAVCRWSEGGSPEVLATDNGPSFKSTVFTDACNDLAITIERTIAGAPTMRGTMERVFRTCGTGLLPRLNGRTFSDVVEKGDHPAEKRACLNPEDICTVLVRWIVDIYHNTPHSGLGGRTPREQWEADHRAGNYPLKAAPDRRAKRLAFGKTRTAKGTKAGITVFGVRYQSELLARFIVQSGPRSLTVRWDPEDLGAVEVELDGQWHEVPAVHDFFHGLHLQVWVTARRGLRSRSAKQEAWAADVVREAVRDIVALNQHRSLQFKLIDKPYSDKHLAHLQESLFASFHITETKPQVLPAPGGRGRIIIPDTLDADACGSDDPKQALAPATRRPPSDEDDWELPE
ncbi:DDE-type integrase/transposase/recombinase [Cereibacter sphaeroides]|uniref:Mu transposase C-terminal domain-containing protein n=1 Tax=Cereibacter sphaeroides TaxID=1063 RepID=UPI001F35D935|nr:Mu transposase C-terminal domain-containing protein [Cereibacter sphaeroides]MCE6950296.1 DDE-type integrase/transposase/recombinase [Cereibacter sphaeroides]